MKTLKAVLLLFALFAAKPAHAAQLTYGKYFGTLQMDGQPEAIAVSMDAFITQINGPTVYPVLEVIVRANLGGYFSSEYVSYDFYDPTYNFERGILSLNDAKNDLSGNLTITNSEAETVLEGPVIHRLSNTKGKMRLVMKLDDSQPLSSLDLKLPLVTILKGEYRGTCGRDEALLQIETGRGLGASAPGNALKDYSLTGRLGFKNGPICGTDKSKSFCGLYSYSTGTYSPFSNHITLQGPLGTLDCTKQEDSLQCKAFGYDKKGNCSFSKAPTPSTLPAQASSGFFLDIPASEMKPLPVPNPPFNESLVEALGGDFYGFLHHENRDVYQLIEMGILASTSTENQHIENQVTVNPTMQLRLGSSWNDGPGLTLVFPERIFGQTQGFAFQSGDDDFFAVIGDWRAGYLSGVLYSRSYGRVGTFELQKGKRPPLIAGMKLLDSPRGDYRGPVDAPPKLKNVYSVSVEVPNQVSGAKKGEVPLLGSFRGPGAMTMFDASSLDLNTGALSFMILKNPGDRIVAGQMNGDQMHLLWPVAPALGAPMGGYQNFTYQPKNSARGSDQ